jgi:hypothetical protein
MPMTLFRADDALGTKTILKLKNQEGERVCE